MTYRGDIDPLVRDEADEDVGRYVRIPHPRSLDAYRHAVSFTREDIIDLLGASGQDLLEPFAFPIGGVPLDVGDMEGLPLDTRPLVRIDDVLVIAAPRHILTAARNGLMRACTHADRVESLAEAYHSSIWSGLVMSLLSLGCRLQSVVDTPMRPGWSAGVFSVDVDKAIYCLLITDDLSDLDPDGPWTPWDTPDLGDEIASHLQVAEEALFYNHLDLNELQFLVVTQGVGRVYHYGFPQDRATQASTILACEGADLESIMLAEEGRRDLALWYFAQDREQFQLTTGIVSSWSLLDEYDVYVSNRRSYYFSDGTRPTGVSFLPGGKGNVRREIQSKWKFQTIPGLKGHGVEVMRESTSTHSGWFIPRRVSEEPGAHPDSLAVIVGSNAVWVTAPRLDTERFPRQIRVGFTRLSSDLAQMMSYWLWKLTPFLEDLLADVDDLAIEVAIAIEEPAEWLSLNIDRQGPTRYPFSVEQVDNKVLVSLDPSIQVTLTTATNEQERALVAEVLTAMIGIASIKSDLLSKENVTAAVDKYVPLGVNKRLVAIDPSVVPHFPSFIPVSGYRPLQDPQLSRSMDALGQYLTGLGFVVGGIGNHERVGFLQDHVVPFLFGELADLIASLRPDGLLEWFIHRAEALARENALFRFQIPIRESGTSDPSELNEEIREKIAELATARTSNRFAIEFVAACPPTGFRPVSLAVYDEIMALSKHVVDFGFMRDLIEYSLSDIGLSILPSGRLGKSTKDWEDAQKAYLPRFVSAFTARASIDFERTLAGVEGQEDELAGDRGLNEALKDQFGFTVDELVSIYELLSSLETDEIVQKHPWRDVSGRLADNHAWSQVRAEEALGLFTLEPRPSFLNPPKPFRRKDVYPWIFGRGLSYVRRPLVRRLREDDDEIVWGSTTLWEGFAYLFHLCKSGRIKPDCPDSPMDKYRGKIVAEIGEHFNDEVATTLGAVSGTIVKKRVTRIGGIKIQDKGADLGDVDVLVLVPAVREIILFECKKFVLARTPRELSNEVTKLFRGSGGKVKKSAIHKHLRRARWVEAHVDDLLDEFGQAKGDNWHVKPVIVTDHPIMSPIIVESPVDILTVREAKAWLQAKTRSV